MVLMMGLGTQMIAWPVALCEGLVDSGLRVIRFDNRDIGLSEKMENAHIPQPARTSPGKTGRPGAARLTKGSEYMKVCDQGV